MRFGRILPGSRVQYKSLISDKVYHGKVVAINDRWARIEDPQGMRVISVDRLKFVPNTFAGKSA